MPSIWDYFRLFFAPREELRAAGIMADLFRWPQFVTCAIILSAILFIVIYFRNKCTDKAYKITMISLWSVVAVLEPSKIIWDTFVENNGVFQWGVFPLFTCSIFLYIAPIIIWMKKDHWLRDTAFIWLCSWNLLGGLVNFVYPVTLNTYPILHFAGLHSVIYHSVLIFCALFTLTTKQYKLTNILDACRAMWIVGLFSIPSICINHFFGVDCMFFNGTTFPWTLISDPIKNGVGLWFWILFMFFIYLLIMCLFELPGTIIRIKSGDTLLPKKSKSNKMAKKQQPKINVRKNKKSK